ncbi:MAG: DNA mismatch repair protein MutS [Magnetococcales bacterium]|nr:DNA mismatch repair protein MutS [Magnetococcales bacterium]
MSKETNNTPMMAQYWEIKAKYPDALLFYRMGDFYELFFDDAKIAAEVLDIALTVRGKNAGEDIPMAGIPWRNLDPYLKTAIEAGYKVAICEQMEPPGTGKGPVRREVLRVVTRGTLTEENMLDPGANNFLVAVVAATRKEEGPALALLDLSTGEFRVALAQSWDHGVGLLSAWRPVEVVVPEDWVPPTVMDPWKERLTRRSAWEFDLKQARGVLMDHFQVTSLEGFGLERSLTGQAAAAALIHYCRESQRGALNHINGISVLVSNEGMVLDDACRRNLELNVSLRDGERRGSLLGVLDTTMTAMGSRLLAQWLNYPLQDIQAINRRQEGVRWLLHHGVARDGLRQQLKAVRDMERLLGRIVLRRASPKDLGALRDTLLVLPQIGDHLSDEASLPAVLQEIRQGLEGFDALRDRLHASLVDLLPAALKEGAIFRPGFHAELDRLRDLAGGGRDGLMRLEAEEREKTGIPSLKIKFHRSFGYTIDITHTHKDKVPYYYQPRQTMTGSMRYTTPELKEFEAQILDAEERLTILEADLFEQLLGEVTGHVGDLQRSARHLATLDCLVSFAHSADQRGYCCPEVNPGHEIRIERGRHPVVEVFTEGDFIANDALLDGEGHRIGLITGPNMSGKSTFMRQVALIVLMAHMGAFVPAQSAVIGLTDRIFTRVGAADDLAGGRSTFMVEMTETAYILHHATPRSLVILDEIGRGTATYEGLSIAWAVVEFLQVTGRGRTLFATHYHELTALEKMFPGIVNHTVEVREADGRPLFMHAIIPGAADQSYGIHIAELAGLPALVTERAWEVLADLQQRERGVVRPPIKPPAQRRRKSVDPSQMSLFPDFQHAAFMDLLNSLNPDNMSPREALEALYRLKGLLQSMPPNL